MSDVPAPTMFSRLAAEFVGTFWLVFGGCGAAVLAAGFLTEDGIHMGIGFLGVAFAFGLTVLTGAYAVGHISGGHFNPAVTFGVFLAGRIEAKAVLQYIGTQIVGGIVAAVVLFVVASGQSDFAIEPGAAGSFATNGYGDLSPGGYSLLSALVLEIVLTAIFLWVILGTTDGRAPVGFAPLAIGLSLTLIHLVAIPVTNTSVNPARSLAVAVFNPAALAQVWLFFVAPAIGAAIAGLSYKLLFAAER
ncbi:aquaporin Z [Brachybacterium sp. P6-10-X1]|uniref:aquaporin Z n=1 Tax=Brachybacterium sp. P6-10-X1 TaxID=1903186 RepID=UPI000971AF80|nr:aquaporin Z [Brachybacterium sp. P6-10-X1]APX32125.1 aquaporin Z [Brachybacterium sp. P6-10-X1]